jgi:hypothetical protein
MDTTKRKKLGKKTRRLGKEFEKEVEKDLERKGWIVVKFNKQVNLEKNILETARGQFNPFFKRIVGEGSGFPDFLCLGRLPFFSKEEYGGGINTPAFHIQLVESKIIGKLDKPEKDKIAWIKKNLKIPVILAKKGQLKGSIIYENL